MPFEKRGWALRYDNILMQRGYYAVLSLKADDSSAVAYNCLKGLLVSSIFQPSVHFLTTFIVSSFFVYNLQNLRCCDRHRGQSIITEWFQFIGVC